MFCSFVMAVHSWRMTLTSVEYPARSGLGGAVCCCDPWLGCEKTGLGGAPPCTCRGGGYPVMAGNAMDGGKCGYGTLPLPGRSMCPCDIPPG